jgi:hypothetical protein
MTDEVMAELVQHGLHDWVPLHDVVWCSTLGVLSDDTKRRTLRVLERLYGDGLMVPGDLGERGFEAWLGNHADWLERDRMDLERLEWQPMNEGHWLRLTEHGRDIAGREFRS